MFAAVTRPSTVGAIAPSSRHLADAMARAAAGAPRLIELGAGTGAITAALCRQHEQIPMLAVEMNDALAQHLRQRFPRVEVRTAAAHLVLRDVRCAGPTALVSSLPFRSLRPPLRARTSRAIERFLLAAPQRRLVQYTYLPRPPFTLRLGAALRWRCVETVWRNAPPAWVWELSVALA